MPDLIVAVLLLLASALPAAAQRKDPAGLTSEILLATDAAHAGEPIRAALRVKLNEGFHVHSNKPLDEYLIATVLTFEPAEGIALQEIAYPEPVLIKAGGFDEPIAVYEHDFAIGATFALDASVAVGEHKVKGSLRYQACDDKACFQPMNHPVELRINVVPADQALTPQNQDVFSAIKFGAPAEHIPLDPPSKGDTTSAPPADAAPAPVPTDGDVLARLDQFEVLATAGGYLNQNDFLAFIDQAESGKPQAGAFDGQGPLAIIALVLIGGLALNLTPCVLPMVPVNLAIIGAGAKAGSRARGFALGGVYGFAMAVVYGVLGLIVILTGSAFGQINSSPWFNIAMALLFVVLSLAMFDIILIDFSKFQAKIGKGGAAKGSFLLAFIMGGVSALLAGACVAPIVIAVVLFAGDLYAKGTVIALALPFLLGLGMAIPWPIAGAGMAFLPKPGMWMVRVKQAFGLFVLAFAAYYGYLAYEAFDARNVDSAEVAKGVEEQLKEGWHANMSEGLAVARAENKPVLVDMWATWCKNCLVMDKTTLKDPEVLKRLEGYIKIKYQAEDLTISPTKEILERFNGVGLPTYAILRSAR